MTSAKGAATEVSYIADDGEPVTVDFDRVDAHRVVRGRPVRIPVSRAGQRNYPGLYFVEDSELEVTGGVSASTRLYAPSQLPP